MRIYDPLALVQLVLLGSGRRKSGKGEEDVSKVEVFTKLDFFNRRRREIERTNDTLSLNLARIFLWRNERIV